MQIEAASSLRYLIELDETEKPVLAVLPDILNEYFRIMQEIGLDEVCVIDTSVTVVAVAVFSWTFSFFSDSHRWLSVVQLEERRRDAAFFLL